MKRAIFTGGGSSGHVTPNLAIMQAMQQQGWEIHYLGTAAGIENTIIGKTNVPFHGISSGKLRRYFSWKNFIDPVNVIIGIIQSLYWCVRLRPRVVFSKGGFVALPVVVAAWLLRIPVIAHESDFTPGLANRLCFPFVKKICITFSEATKFFKAKNKVVVTGTPVRPELLQGDAVRGKAYCGFSSEKPVLFVFGGGLGSVRVNDVIRASLPSLLAQFNVIHICGEGKVDHRFDQAGYRQFDYVHDQLPDLLAAADVVVSRAGANSIYELLALKKPHILLPLSARASRGDQIVNAKYFSEKGMSLVIQDEQLSSEELLKTLELLKTQHAAITQKLAQFEVKDSVSIITQLLETT